MQVAKNKSDRLLVYQAPGLLEYLGFCFMGSSLISGPTYEYMDYMDLVH